MVVPEIQASGVQLIYQQDNAPAHKKASVTAFLAQQSFETLDWPPKPRPIAYRVDLECNQDENQGNGGSSSRCEGTNRDNS